ncbi:MAG: imidazole glycerol phosphate synthase subunit HisH [Bacillota bacterium]|nr:imidazole glycerol phosphate synthase subunit HisH [Bacillota bacterium]
MIAIIDYGVGNLFSLRSSFRFIGEEACVSADPAVLKAADRLILPGVGAFSDAAAKLHYSGLKELIQEEAAAGKPLMGICLGMQMLFERSLEYGTHQGLGLLPGSIVPMEPVIPENYKIPHIGWNQLHFPVDKPRHSLFREAKEGDYVYFVHSYYATDCDSLVIANTDYGAVLTAAVAKENVMGCQFHPEKSGSVGLNILRAFCQIGGKA